MCVRVKLKLNLFDCISSLNALPELEASLYLGCNIVLTRLETNEEEQRNGCNLWIRLFYCNTCNTSWWKGGENM